jgi:hypothetical protein
MSEEPFVRRFQADCDELVAARWWNEAFQHAVWSLDGLGTPETRRQVLLAAGVLGGAALVAWLGAKADGGNADDGDNVVTMDALEAQRRNGWNVGAPYRRLFYDGVVDTNVLGRNDWRTNLDTLGTSVTPTQTALVPYFVPTLFQVLTASDFYQGLVPIHTASMDRAESAGRALAELYRGRPETPETALVIDARGPDAVAAAVTLADLFEPVLLFDNWPHPLGVVPSHEVVAAVLYYRPWFESARARRPAAAPPVFVIDSRRLNPYQDASDSFDNRYLAKLPGPDGFHRLGVKHLLYVSDVPLEHEPDDLNADFVALTDAGIDVKMVPLSDFRPQIPGGAVYSYGGAPTSHLWFWHSYGGYRPSGGAPVVAGPPPSGGAPVVAGPPPEAGLSRAAAYHPVARPTIFASHLVGGLGGVGKQKPSGFGRVSLRTAPGTGTISIGRSGSLGRSRSYWHGG